ncbi:MAG: glycoside hydrolase family 30 beta sandwich domain-containing protein [Sediminibacterium sp.]|nr:glycoside hydrolase family 30 beta sandwich domain-containing protein [Sediminibacterium sp.]
MFKVILFVLSPVLFCNCSKNTSNSEPIVNKNAAINYWTTNADQSLLLNKQTALLYTGNINNVFPVIDIDSTAIYQSIEGFGFTLTGASAFLINQMDNTSKANLLKELFANTENSIGVSYLRISIGASDLSSTVFSYNDLSLGETDTALNKFSLAYDTLDLIPILKQILNINPAIKILASPWSPPTWMKTNGKSMGGYLLPQYYRVYAKYFTKYIQQMHLSGIPIDAVTIQNEPEHGGNNPSMLMTASEQADFIKNHLGPLFQSNAIKTKIIIWDHNCDHPNYPISILNDPFAKQYIAGSAFHLYTGDISALTTVHNAHPDKALYFTEQWTGKTGTFSGDLQWHVKNVIIGSMRNFSKVALEWNLANDPDFGPHTQGGCTECKGALTIFGSTFTRNVSYYIIAHASKFVPVGSVRIGSGISGNLFSVAFLTPNGNKVIIVMNNGVSDETFNIRLNERWLLSKLKSGSVSTFVL